MSKLRKARIERICRRKLKSGTLTEKQREAVKAVLNDQLALNTLTTRVGEIPAIKAADEGDEKSFLEKLIEVFTTKILPLILAIAKAFGLI